MTTTLKNVGGNFFLHLSQFFNGIFCSLVKRRDRRVVKQKAKNTGKKKQLNIIASLIESANQKLIGWQSLSSSGIVSFSSLSLASQLLNLKQKPN
ncbi:MAG TPA: hypothetical protein V6C71_15855 [Coleofasciculaceae cyanobacterium]